MADEQVFEEAAAYIEDLPRFTKKHPLAHTREMMRRLGNPAEDKKIIHVAGTNGKGSVCAMLQAVLLAEGKQVGMFTSPHLVRVNERIRIQGVPVSDAVFCRIFERVRAEAVRMDKEGLEHPSYFEFLFACAMCAFAEADVEYVILETGLGGRLDATTVPEHPILTVITSIGLDHTQYLGHTVAEIAAEKAGILKPDVPLVFDGSNTDAAVVIREKAAALCVPVQEVSEKDFSVRNVSAAGVSFTRSADQDGRIWRIPFGGSYEAMNAALALAAAETLFEEHEALWADALAGMHWEGRMEEVRPHLILDGAHNPDAVRAFVETVRAREAGDSEEDARPVLLFSAVADKQYDEMIRILCEGLPAKAYIVTEISDDRRVPADELAGLFKKYGAGRVLCRPDLREALHAAFAERGRGEVYCLGSLYLAGMVKKLVEEV